MIFLDYEKQAQQYLSVTPLGFSALGGPVSKLIQANRTMTNSISYQKGVRRPAIEPDLQGRFPPSKSIPPRSFARHYSRSFAQQQRSHPAARQAFTRITSPVELNVMAFKPTRINIMSELGHVPSNLPRETIHISRAESMRKHVGQMTDPEAGDDMESQVTELKASQFGTDKRRNSLMGEDDRDSSDGLVNIDSNAILVEEHNIPKKPSRVEVATGIGASRGSPEGFRSLKESTLDLQKEDLCPESQLLKQYPEAVMRELSSGKALNKFSSAQISTKRARGSRP